MEDDKSKVFNNKSLDDISRVVNEILRESSLHLPQHNVVKVIELLDDDLTVPFIARYRKNATGEMDADNIRKIQQTYENIKKVQAKVEVVIKKISSVAPPEVIHHLKCAKSLDEVQELYAPYKTGAKGTLAERARNIGLEGLAQQLIKQPNRYVNLAKHVNSNTEGLKNVCDIQNGIQHIIADMVAKDKTIKEKMKDSVEQKSVFIISKVTPKAKELDKKEKFSNYYDFKSNTNRLPPHSVLAINRAETLKILSVKLEIIESARDWILKWIKSLWVPRHATDENKTFISQAVDDAFKRLIEKSFLRKIRSKMSKKAELEALEVFYNNLKHLLLVAPVKNKVVLSIDPGFSNGCKVAVINPNGGLLETAVIFPFRLQSKAATTLINFIQKYSIELVAIGNGTACRETETFISDMIKNGVFKPFNVSYSIVSECGASVYSVSKEAKKEFPNLDPNLISSVSIGRRLQDPLLELHKIEAKHIGVGMYQHDLDSQLLNGVVDGVIEDCVSFVGVDLNACSSDILRRVAGIKPKQAESIIKYRNENGGFVNREELRNVKGIGAVTYRNCAGFVRIIPKSKEFETKINSQKNDRKRKLNTKDSKCTVAKKIKLDENSTYEEEFLDQTWIHPESYPITYKLLEHLKASSSMIGSKQLKEMILLKITNDQTLENLANELKADVCTLKLILDGLQQPPDYDIRTEFEQAPFKTGITSIEQLEKNQSINGIVNNTTSFGVFVDIGVSTNGLIHNSKLQRNITLGPGDRVECTIHDIDIQRKRIGLIFKTKLSKELKLK